MLKELSYVIAVAEKGNVSKAAESLFISQPSLSRYIKDLENRLGVQLFQRINNRLVLTYAGEKYVETSKKITGLYSDLEKELSGINESLSGRLCIGCALLRMSYNMPAILKAFISKYPNVELQLYENYTTKGLEDILLAGEIDLAIINKRDRPRVCYIPFFEEELLLAVPPTQTLALKGVERPGLLYPWIDIRLLHNQPRLFSFGDLATKWELSIAYREGMLFSNTAIEFINMVKNIYKDSGLG